ncbi:MAG: hypothetical protein NZO58_07025 [Gemmataceae bacterium]|nr:hypothetical protein [Gemmataceae bacterium]
MDFDAETAGLETDPKFPSGPWTGFFLQPLLPGKHRMELRLTFRRGTMTGDGRDWVGDFVIRGRYNPDDGRCSWTKRYLGKHDVWYQGYNEGRGIWGVWEIPADQNAGQTWRGGFHIWPEGCNDPSAGRLDEAAEVPVEDGDLVGAP